MLFNFQGTRPVRCSQRRIFILAHLFGFVKGFFFLLPKALPSSNPLPRPFFRPFGWVAVSPFLSEAARLVYHIRRPLSRPFSSQPIFLRPGSGGCCQGARLFGNSFIRIPHAGSAVNGFSSFFRSFFLFSSQRHGGRFLSPTNRPPEHPFYSSFIFRRDASENT